MNKDYTTWDYMVVIYDRTCRFFQELHTTVSLKMDLFKHACMGYRWDIMKADEKAKFVPVSYHYSEKRVFEDSYPELTECFPLSIGLYRCSDTLYHIISNAYTHIPNEHYRTYVFSMTRWSLSQDNPLVIVKAHGMNDSDIHYAYYNYLKPIEEMWSYDNVAHYSGEPVEYQKYIDVFKRGYA